MKCRGTMYTDLEKCNPQIGKVHSHIPDTHEANIFFIILLKIEENVINLIYNYKFFYLGTCILHIFKLFTKYELYSSGPPKKIMGLQLLYNYR
jgi:hypothetical protein